MQSGILHRLRCAGAGGVGHCCVDFAGCMSGAKEFFQGNEESAVALHS